MIKESDQCRAQWIRIILQQNSAIYWPGGIVGHLQVVALACSVTCEMEMRCDTSSLQLPVRLGAWRPETQARRLVKGLAELDFSVELKPVATAS